MITQLDGNKLLICDFMFFLLLSGPIVAGVILLIKAAKYSCVAISEVQGPP